MKLTFTVDHQNIKRIDTNKVVADSKNYLYAEFVFLSDEWKGKTITAIFKRGTEPYHVLLDNNMSCLVPAEVIKPNGFNVSVFTGDLVTCDKANVLVAFSGLSEGGTPQPPTPDIYAQILAKLDSLSAGGGGSSSGTGIGNFRLEIDENGDLYAITEDDRIRFEMDENGDLYMITEV